MSEDSPIASVYATFPSEAEAARIGRRLVEERLAACVNILGPCRAIYRWRGRIEDGEEVAAIFKTARPGVLIDRLAELHSYEVPAAVAWPIAEAHPLYRAWVASESESEPDC
jgi:periplasmic divalent cation tolerance protein